MGICNSGKKIYYTLGNIYYQFIPKKLYANSQNTEPLEEKYFPSFIYLDKILA